MTLCDKIHETIMMRPDTSDELTILAKDAAGLAKDERALINRAADEMRDWHRYISRVQLDLHEANGHRLAMSEKMGEMQRELDALRKRVAVPLVKLDKAPDPLPSPIAWTTLISGPLGVNGSIYGNKPIGG